MDKYKYTYEITANYCYKDSDVLINKLNITNDEDLFNAEKELVALRIYELNEKPLKGNFDFNYLKCIHKYLFQDIYRWAGDIRNCNIAKQDLFCLTEHIESFGNEVFDKLKNALHPFREGNGRSQRIFIESLAKINGIYLDLTNVSKMDMIIASHESINGNYTKLKNVFIKNSKILNEEEKKEYINIYCSNEMKQDLIN